MWQEVEFEAISKLPFSEEDEAKKIAQLDVVPVSHIDEPGTTSSCATEPAGTEMGYYLDISNSGFHGPGEFPSCNGNCNLHGNLADLKALVVANQKVSVFVTSQLYQSQIFQRSFLFRVSTLSWNISSWGLEVVQAYMAHIQHHAEVAIRNLLRDVSMTTDVVLRASDKMDDGSVINLRVEIDLQEGNATSDFEGTSLMVINKLNAPREISNFAIIYCLRCMLGYDVPLNQGCLPPIHVHILKWSLLEPGDEVAIVCSNLVTSQRIVDVIMNAFKVCTTSQGCMNNTTFGDESFDYYETVAAELEH
ncbi:unnamed protein product [Clavelina lepadiformis]|uniref:Hydantoinase B/oxoprolinase domain-containing protein n=1 Tax=Clavelina lepadiformis TaxID=159417 RepID=A0ABP0G9U4_CLALP